MSGLGCWPLLASRAVSKSWESHCIFVCMQCYNCRSSAPNAFPTRASLLIRKGNPAFYLKRKFSHPSLTLEAAHSWLVTKFKWSLDFHSTVPAVFAPHLATLPRPFLNLGPVLKIQEQRGCGSRYPYAHRPRPGFTPESHAKRRVARQ